MMEQNHQSYAEDRNEKSSKVIFSFFQLPYHVQVNIISHLSLYDTKVFSITSKDSLSIAQDQFMWRKKIWRHAKAWNMYFLPQRVVLNRSIRVLIKDPMLVDMKKMYTLLEPLNESEARSDPLDMANLLSKYDPPSPSIFTYTSIGLQELFHYFHMFFIKPRPRLFHDPFSKGENAPTFMLFGPPETPASRKLALSFIASKDAMFETVGLVRGKPGGIGGGVTVDVGNHRMNFLPMRRARPRLLVDKPTGVEFHSDVAQVVASKVDGLIYYMDSKCTCNRDSSKASEHTGTSLSVSKDWQTSRDTSCSSTTYVSHDLDSLFLELEAMLRALPSSYKGPILVILVQQKGPIELPDSLPVEDEFLNDANYLDKIHLPFDLKDRMSRIQNPWMVISVDVPSLKGVRPGLNWIFDRTLLIRSN